MSGENKHAWRTILETLADELDDMSEREIREAFGANEDTDHLWAKDIVMSKLSDAHSVVDASRDALNKQRGGGTPLFGGIPRTVDGRRSLFDTLLAGRFGESDLLVAFRNGQRPSDKDIEGILEDLVELGILKGDDGSAG